MINTKVQLLEAGLQLQAHTDPGMDTSNAIPAAMFVPTHNFQELQRLIVTQGIDAAKKLIGQETIDFNFDCELQASGTVGTPPFWGSLFEACGFTKTAHESAIIDSPVVGFGNTGLSNLTIASGGIFTGLEPRAYKIKVTTLGESGAAKVAVTCRGDSTQNSIDNIVTTATAIDLGDEGATIIFTFASGSLMTDDTWYVYCFPAGIKYKPTSSSDTFNKAYFKHYIDGLKFEGSDAVGNFTLKASAGEIATLNFNFKSVFVAVGDAIMPSYSFPDKVPPIVEKSSMTLDDDSTLFATSMSVESNNTITERKSVNAAQGIDSYRITQRDNTFSVDPESKLETDFAFWDKFRDREEVPFAFKIGNTSGNIVHVIIRRAVFDNLNPADSEDWLRYGITGQCRPSPLGNDNIEIFVC